MFLVSLVFSIAILVKAESPATSKPADNQDAANNICQQYKTKDISFAQNRTSLRTRQIQSRLEFAKNRITKAKSSSLDTKALENLVPSIMLRASKVESSYRIWLDAAKSFDCTSVGTQQNSREKLKKAHDKAWDDFKEAITYYNESVRPEYRKISKTAISSPFVGGKSN